MSQYPGLRLDEYAHEDLRHDLSAKVTLKQGMQVQVMTPSQQRTEEVRTGRGLLGWGLSVDLLVSWAETAEWPLDEGLEPLMERIEKIKLMESSEITIYDRLRLKLTTGTAVLRRNG